MLIWSRHTRHFNRCRFPYPLKWLNLQSFFIGTNDHLTLPLQLALINPTFNNPTTLSSDRFLLGIDFPTTVLLPFHISVIRQFTFQHYNTDLFKQIFQNIQTFPLLSDNIKRYWISQKFKSLANDNTPPL